MVMNNNDNVDEKRHQTVFLQLPAVKAVDGDVTVPGVLRGHTPHDTTTTPHSACINGDRRPRGKNKQPLAAPPL